MLNPLRKKRLELGFQQFRLARDAKVSQARLSYFETGLIEDLREDEKERIAKILQTDVMELFRKGGGAQ